jgi:hypothetical protein
VDLTSTNAIAFGAKNSRFSTTMDNKEILEYKRETHLSRSEIKLDPSERNIDMRETRRDSSENK